jgi:hypothetical protein
MLRSSTRTASFAFWPKLKTKSLRNLLGRAFECASPDIPAFQLRRDDDATFPDSLKHFCTGVQLSGDRRVRLPRGFRLRGASGSPGYVLSTSTRNSPDARQWQMVVVAKANENAFRGEGNCSLAAGFNFFHFVCPFSFWLSTFASMRARWPGSLHRRVRHHQRRASPFGSGAMHSIGS